MRLCLRLAEAACYAAAATTAAGTAAAAIQARCRLSKVQSVKLLLWQLWRRETNDFFVCNDRFWPGRNTISRSTGGRLAYYFTRCSSDSHRSMATTRMTCFVRYVLIRRFIHDTSTSKQYRAWNWFALVHNCCCLRLTDFFFKCGDA